MSAAAAGARSGLLAAALAAALAPAHGAGLLVSLGEPGYFGRLDLAGYPRPRLARAEPAVLHPRASSRPPVYLRIPPGYASNWREYCRAFDACGERAYFVDDGWYLREYVPRYRDRHPGRRDDASSDGPGSVRFAIRGHGPRGDAETPAGGRRGTSRDDDDPRQRRDR